MVCGYIRFSSLNCILTTPLASSTWSMISLMFLKKNLFFPFYSSFPEKLWQHSPILNSDKKILSGEFLQYCEFIGNVWNTVHYRQRLNFKRWSNCIFLGVLNIFLLSLFDYILHQVYDVKVSIFEVKIFFPFLPHRIILKDYLFNMCNYIRKNEPKHAIFLKYKTYGSGSLLGLKECPGILLGWHPRLFIRTHAHSMFQLKKQIWDLVMDSFIYTISINT